MPQYSKTTWVDGTAPAISAANLNKLEQGVFDSIRQDGSTTMSAQFVTIAGSAATPAIAPTGDANTGIFFPAADTIAFGEGGSEAMRIDSNGRVGIGTDNLQTDKFEVNGGIKTSVGSGGGLKLFETNATRQMQLNLSVDGEGVLLNSTYVTGGGSISHFRFQTGNVERVRFTAGGNVGIGTTSPDVFSRGYSGTILGISSSGQSAIELNSATGNTAYLDLGVAGTRRGNIQVTASDMTIGTNGAYPLYFAANNDIKMTLTSAGNVGIGTTSPDSKLDISATASTTVPALKITSSANLASNDIVRMQIAGVTNGFRMFQDASSYVIYSFEGGTNYYNVLLGYTSSNGTYPLQVNGQIFATSSTIATSDGRYKKDVVALDGALDIVTKLNPVQFSWKEHPVHKFNTDVPTVGFIAQEVAEVLKDKAYLTSLIKKSECTWETETGETIEREVTRDVETEVEREITEEIDGEEVTRTITETVIEQVTETITEPVKETHTEEFLGIAESNMIAILTKAIQELKAEVDALKAQLAK